MREAWPAKRVLAELGLSVPRKLISLKKSIDMPTPPILSRYYPNMILADPKINRIFVMGNPAEFDVIEALARDLDLAPD